MTEQPLATVYRDGLTNLNGTASRLLPSVASHLLLLPPTSSEQYWLALVDDSAEFGAVPLLGRRDRVGLLRFRALELGRQLFAAVPTGHVALRLELETITPDLFRLRPLPVATEPKAKSLRPLP